MRKFIGKLGSSCCYYRPKYVSKAAIHWAHENIFWIFSSTFWRDYEKISNFKIFRTLFDSCLLASSYFLIISQRLSYIFALWMLLLRLIFFSGKRPIYFLKTKTLSINNVWGRSRGCSVEPPKMKQLQIF